MYVWVDNLLSLIIPNGAPVSSETLSMEVTSKVFLKENLYVCSWLGSLSLIISYGSFILPVIVY